MPKAPPVPKTCDTCQFHYSPPEGDIIFPEIDSGAEGFCRVDPPSNRGGRSVVSGMYKVTANALPACGKWHKGDQDW